MKELVSSGEFDQVVSTGGAGEEGLEDRLRGLLRRDKVMLFMKGSPSAPQCGFSRTIVDILGGIR